MACTTVTVQGPQVQSSGVNITSSSGGTNQASLQFEITNPNDFTVTVTVEYTRDGSRVGTEQFSVPSSGLGGLERNFAFDLARGAGSQDFQLCVNVTDTVS